MDVFDLREVVYRHLVDHGAAPTREVLAQVVGDREAADALLSEMHARHLVVLDDRPHRRGEIRMALPFATEPTGYRVTAAGGAWWANCAWDALAIPAALHTDARIDATWSDTGEPLRLQVADGELDDVRGHIGFAVPARQWWDDIVFT